jgi:type VI secretion system protein ImpM
VTSAVAPSAVGFFGKLPCKGDFLQRRITADFLDVWDPWLQRCVHASREALQESWLSAYLTSPVWRFVLSSAVCGSGAYAGVLAPSVDRVGRYFPLTLVSQIDIDVPPLEFAAASGSWFESLEALVAVALDESTVDLEAFDAQVAALSPPPVSQRLKVAEEVFKLLEHSRFPAQGAAWRVPLGTADGLQAAVNALAYRDLAAQLRPLSIWWSDGSAAAAASWLNLRGLPDPAVFGAMLDGQWTRDGWQDLGEWADAAAGATGGARGNAVHAAAQCAHAADAAPGSSQTTYPAVPPSSAADAAPLATAGDGVGLAAPHVTLPAAQLTDIENNRAAFVLRPEIGLWAAAAAGEPGAGQPGAGEPGADTTALRFIALALQQILPAGSLTGLAEAVRDALTRVHEQLSYLGHRDVQRIEAQGLVVALLAFGNECAIMAAGPVQFLRVRAGVLEEFVAQRGAERDGAGVLSDLLGTAAPVTPPALGAQDFRHLHVQYDRLQREDLWILCAQPLLGPQVLGRLAAIANAGMPLSAQIIMDAAGPLTASGAVPPIITVQL